MNAEAVQLNSPEHEIWQSIGFVESSVMASSIAPIELGQEIQIRSSTPTRISYSSIHSPPSGLTPRKHDPTRDSIIANSSKGWSPLQPKRQGTAQAVSSLQSPTTASSNYSTLPSSSGEAEGDSRTMPIPPPSGGGPRRTSSSFKHVTGNSLVSNSPFKSGTTTTDGRSSMFGSTAPLNTLHIRTKSAASSAAPASPVTPRRASNLLSGIGLGISASSPRRSSGRKASATKSRSSSGSGSGSARKVSSDRQKTPPSERRRVSGEERRAAGGALQSIDNPVNEVTYYDEFGNQSPDVRSSSARKPRQSMGLKGLAQGGLVTRSPFLQQADTVGDDSFDQGALKRSTPQGSPAKAAHVATRFDSPCQPAQEDVFSSPAQANNGSVRRVSPIYKDRVGGTSLLDESPTRRRTMSGSADSLVPFPSQEPSSTSLRAEKPLPPIHYNPSNTATPSKSSITKRRLNGPRLSGSESPTATKQAKTVTFQAVPDVKEFETESVTDHGDKSRDSDADMDDVDLGDGADFNPYGMHMSGVRSDGRGGFSGIVELHDQTYNDHSIGEPHDYESNDGHGTRSVDSHTSEGGYRDESMTANFIDSLVEDGYFSPPAMQTATMPNQIFDTPSVPGETPVLNSFMDFTPKLETPSFGSSLGFSTPAMENPSSLRTNEQDSEVLRSLGGDDIDNAGIPYGRTHHSERVALAHAIPVGSIESIEQPALPKPSARSKEPLLRSTDAAQPSLPVTINQRQDMYGDYPRVQQDGTFVDPFVTIQTASQVYNQGSTGSAQPQGGAPLNRPSHNEQAKVARLLATQSLGLGLPNHPKQPSLPSSGLPAKRYISYGESEDGSEEDESDDELQMQKSHPSMAPLSRQALTTPPKNEDMSDRRPLLSQKLEQLCSPSISSAKRALPKPPQPQQLDIPSPKLAPALLPMSEVLPRSSSPTTQVFGVTLPFALPNIGLSSPLFTAAGSSVNRQPSDSDTVSTESSRPLTPPRTLGTSKKPESPHRIPDFDFESHGGKSFDMDTAMEDDTSPTQDFGPVLAPLQTKSSIDPLRIVKRSSQFGLDQSSVSSRIAGLPGSRSDESLGTANGGSLNGQVRQRISKDMIRARMEERKANKPCVSESGSDSEEDLPMSVVPMKTTLGEKALPPRPSFGEVASRPQLRARTQTRSAQDILAQAGTDGLPEEPKSALDQLVLDFNGMNTVAKPERPQSLVVRHVSSESILTTGPARSGLPTVTSSTLQPICEMSSIDMSLEAGTILAASADPSVRPRRRRSMSTGDARPQHDRNANARMSILSTLDDLDFKDNQSMLAAFEKDVKHITSDRPYRVREQHQMIYATSDDKIKHNKAGDVDSGRAWKQLRKASDMNQYAKELKALKAKAHGQNKSMGTIFVKVLGIESLSLPLPSQETSFCVTLDNGIDYIRTPYTTLKEGARINQEFALVEHANFEFTLGLEVRRDPHIIQMLHNNVPKLLPLPPKPFDSDAASTSSGIRNGGFRNLFGSPRKGSKPPRAMVAEIMPQSRPVSQETNIGHYFPPGEALVGKTHIAFKPIAKNCDSRLLEIRYPMFGALRHQASVAPAPISKGDRPASQPPLGSSADPSPAIRKQVCKITLQIFRLPPLPGLDQDQLPQSIDECLRGMRHHAWHEHEYHEGLLTQKGGDSNVPRRREFKVIGGNLVARNAVTKKTVLSIDLRKVTTVKDENADRNTSAPSTPSRRLQDYDNDLGIMPRSFRLIFEDDEDILFWTDTDEEKAGWMKVLTSLVGKIPTNPLWAELLAARHRHAIAKAQARKASAATEAASEVSK